MIEKFDVMILTLIQEHFQCEFMDMLMNFISLLAEAAAIWILLAMMIALIKKKRTILLALAAALLVNHAFCSLLLKNVFKRIRPFLSHDELISHAILLPKGYSFPSGHTSSSFCAASVLSKYIVTHKALCYLLSACVGFSRLYLNVHYPSDVLVGALLGTIIGCFMTYWTKTVMKEK